MPPQIQGRPAKGPGPESADTESDEPRHPPSCSPAPPATSRRTPGWRCWPPGFACVGLDDFSNSSPEVLNRLQRTVGGQRRCFERVDVCDAAAHGSRSSSATASTRWCTSPPSRRWARAARKPLAYYAQQHRRPAHAVPQRCSAHGCQAPGVQLQRHGVRRARAAADHRGLAAVGHQPLRPTKLMGENILRDLERCRAGLARSRCCATSTRWARTRAAASAKTRAACRTT